MPCCVKDWHDTVLKSSCNSSFLWLLYAIAHSQSWFWCVNELSKNRHPFYCDLFIIVNFSYILFLWYVFASSCLFSLSSLPFICFYREADVLVPAPKISICVTHLEINFEIVPLTSLIHLNITLHWALFLNQYSCTCWYCCLRVSNQMICLQLPVLDGNA